MCQGGLFVQSLAGQFDSGGVSAFGAGGLTPIEDCRDVRNARMPANGMTTITAIQSIAVTNANPVSTMRIASSNAAFGDRGIKNNMQ